jgi:hypothetical protein
VDPPHNLNAERAVLGAVLLDGPSALERIAARLQPADFHAGHHETIFAAMLRLHRAGRPVDLITLSHELQQAEQLDAAGGNAHLALCAEHGAIAAHLDEYVGIVAEMAAKRQLVAFGAQLAARAQNGTGAADLVADMQATAAGIAARAAGPAAPTLLREGLDLAVVWPGGVRFSLTAIRDGRDGVRGELTITHGTRRLHGEAFSLSSGHAREGLRKRLEAKAPGIPWGDYLEETCWRLTQAAREGEPLVILTGRPAAASRELLPRLLYAGEPTLLYADGDTGKSLAALAFAVAIQSGTPLPGGLRPVRAVPVAVLDWETEQDTPDDRLGKLAAGLGIDPPPIFYKPMKRALVDEATQLAADFARRGIGCVMIDSMMFAVGSGDGAAFHEPITAFYNALRLFAPAASLVISHVTSADARGGGAARPFGGAFAFNGPRLIWEAKRDKDVTDATAIAFTCIKANNLPRRPEPFGLRFVPGEGTITVYPFDLREASPQAVASASAPYKIRLALASNGAMTTPEIAEAVGISEAAARTTLRRMAVKGTVHDLGTVEDGKAKRWGLAAR